MSDRLSFWDERFLDLKKNPKIESCSGMGSSLKNTKNTIKTLKEVFNKYHIKSFLDLPCGDWNWMSSIQMGDIIYMGMDLSPSVISHNQEKYDDDKKFAVHDIVKNEICGRYDLILCRNLLFHLSYKNALSALSNFKKSGSRYLLTTTFPKIKENISLDDNKWYPINLEVAPFNFPPPIALYREVEDGKYLGLWDLSKNNF